tara:strand:- start:512 stop:1147 length:636 start_codon:yes stop_codon:yes gene_type:complete
MIKKFLILSCVLATVVTISLSSAVIFSPSFKPVANSIGTTASVYFSSVEKRYIKNNLTLADRLSLHALYGAMVVYGSVFAPEAGAILRNYLYGSGEDLKLSSSYIRNSPVVKGHISKVKNRPGVYKKYLRQEEDKRLSYAYNPYHLKITRNKDGSTNYKLYERIIFHKPKKAKSVKTTFWVGNIKFRISDQLVYAVGNCKPFVAYTTWTDK